MSIFTAAMIATGILDIPSKSMVRLFYYAYAIIDSTYYGTHL